MKKHLVLSRPISNAGDFLFLDKAMNLLKHVMPYDVFEFVHINQINKYSTDFLNKFSTIIYAGGPLFDNRFLRSDEFTLFNRLDEIKPKIHFLACGWYGNNGLPEEIYNYKFDNDVLSNLKKLDENGTIFGCRDYITERVLKNNGIKNTFMTGCCSWYDVDNLSITKFKSDVNNINHIVISDQGLTKNSKYHDIKFKQTINLVKLIKTKFPPVKITYVFQGGITTKYSANYNLHIKEFLEKNNIDYIDISGSSKGFSIYNTADLHIGYRVHSHIYCLSKRIPSILIEEDARGRGVNDALGLVHIQNYSVNNADTFAENQFLNKELNDYIDRLSINNFNDMRCVFEKINSVYNVLIKKYFDINFR